ncbi:carbohydrate kinase family protein [Clostridium folliculivorans]|uniref:Fructokinase n=1 Tax=Clostridium folliculivorans TaxID=2886038 RepID=A0A9W5Y4Z4_9CLOT|nr:carbohydrate kinase [Clostridium folliculivorans]GKU26743.1 fructokinase [Clostridium folliculivorans]GKU31337.1 fructokinase [Clostridium folliculivorans]
MNNIFCIGELLIDFISSDINSSLIEGSNFIKKAGGAPANVTASIAKLGGSAYFGGSVGADSFGVFLKDTIKAVGVNTSYMKFIEKQNTTLAFVSLKDNGERDFIFNRGADENYELSELEQIEVINGKIIHFGSATALLGGSLKATYTELMEKAKVKGTFISFDPNFRTDLWRGRTKEFVEVSRWCMKHADFVKVSDEEALLISGKSNVEEAAKEIALIGNSIVAVTLGKEGTMITDGSLVDIIRSINIKSIDSTGAGDAFVGAVLYRLATVEEPKVSVRDLDTMKEVIAFANKVGAIVCTKLGAIAALPTLQEVNDFR